MLNDAYTEYAPDGSKSSIPYVYERTAGSSGFPGTWDSESEKVKAGIELQIQPYESDGLSFTRSDAEMARRIKFDGNDYPDPDPNGDPGSAFSRRRVNERSLEITEKFKGKITGTRQIELSRDLKTDGTERLVGQSRPKSILVYDRIDVRVQPAGVGSTHTRHQRSCRSTQITAAAFFGVIDRFGHLKHVNFLAPKIGCNLSSAMISRLLLDSEVYSS
jgi:hypothetical protein